MGLLLDADALIKQSPVKSIPVKNNMNNNIEYDISLSFIFNI